MKLSVCLLSALILLSCVKAFDDYKEFTASDIKNNPAAIHALKTGIDFIFKKAAEETGISGRKIEITKIKTAKRWRFPDQAPDYEFHVEAENADVWMRASYQVDVDAEGVLSISAEDYSFDWKTQNDQSVNYDDKVPSFDDNVQLNIESQCLAEDGNTCKEGSAVDTSKISVDSDLRNALRYGVYQISENAYNKFGISKSGVKVRYVYQICGWEKNASRYYYFEADTINANNDTITVSFNVQSEQEGEASGLRLVDWGYRTSYNRTNIDE